MRRYLYRSAVAVISSLFLLNTLLAFADEQVEPYTFSDPVVTYQGKDIAKDDLMEFVVLMYGSPIDTFSSKADAKEVLSTYLLRQFYAKKANEEKLLEKNQRYERQIKMIELGIQSELYLQHLRESIVVSDEEILAAYEAKIADIHVQDEYLLSHILVETEEELQQINSDLSVGIMTFSEAALKHSLDPASAVSGGDMSEWLTPDALSNLFNNEALTLLENSDELVSLESEFGHHLVKMIDQRKTPIPNFEGIKDQLYFDLREEKLAIEVYQLRQQMERDLNL